MSKLRTFIKRQHVSKYILVAAVLLALAISKRTYDLAAAPTSEKDCSFSFPYTTDQSTIIITYPGLTEAGFTTLQTGGTINDASCLNQTNIHAITEASSDAAIAAALEYARAHNLKVTPAGERHSMGGQSFSPGGLVIDMRARNEITIDTDAMQMTVGSGASWKDIQAQLDPRGLAVKAMQSINIFTVGGTLSVNAHGVAHDPGQIASTVRSMRIMLSSGEIVEASPTVQTELFSAVIGGYGLSGIILDVTLDIVKNEVYAWKTEYITFADFASYYTNHVVDNDTIGLFYARLSISPTSYLTETAIHRYEKIDGTIAPEPLKPPSKIWIKRLIFNLSKTGSVGRWIRWTVEKYLEPGVHTCITRNNALILDEEVCVASRNQKMNQSMEYLDVRQSDTNILHEYFLPLNEAADFIDELRDIVIADDVNLLNVTLRIVTKDTITALPYAKDDRIAFVLYFNQALNETESIKLKAATQHLIDSAIAHGGTFYLPYQLYYSPEQLKAAYPDIDAFFALKRKYDPIELFSNRLYEKYGATLE